MNSDWNPATSMRDRQPTVTFTVGHPVSRYPDSVAAGMGLLAQSSRPCQMGKTTEPTFSVRPSSAYLGLSAPLLTCLDDFAHVSHWPNLENVAVLHGGML